jgi:arylsulfatase A-like enzyme
MLEWIDSLEGQRFFLTYLPVAGHHPYPSPGTGPFPPETDIGRYRNALYFGDQSLAALLEGLRARHLDSRTVVVVYGDHGEAFGQHPGNVGHTMFIDEENVKVPFLIAIPGVTTGGSRVKPVASLLDAAPTILDVVGLPAPPEYQGRSMLEPGARMALFFTDYALGWLGLRDGCWKYQLEINADRSALYDVCRDPGETRNLAGAAPDRIGAYRDRVLRWSAAEKAEMTPGVRRHFTRSGRPVP